MSEPILTLSEVSILFPHPAGGSYPVVHRIGLEIFKGQTMGLVGESGSGKSMTALSVLGLVPPPGKLSGSIRFHGQELIGLPEPAYQELRGSKIAIVFQDPAAALNPVLSIETQLVETILRHRRISPAAARQVALESLAKVDIPSPQERLKNYPHQLSGGMKQRVLIAMALSCEPEILILDEPTTALDVTVQAQILDLIELIQRSNSMSILLISHDLAIISEISDYISVMYSGNLVETGTVTQIIQSPRHPYTNGLLNAIPKTNLPKSKLLTMPGTQPNPAERPGGCPFHPRCPNATNPCSLQNPGLTQQNEHAFACWNPMAQP